MKRLAVAYEWALLLPTLLPLFYVEGMMYPLMTPKTLALRALALAALALFAYLAISGRTFFWNRLRSWQAWIPGGLLLIAYITSAAGVDFYHSFWSTFERGDGLLTLTACVIYFYLVLLSADRSWLQRFLKSVAWVGSLSAIYLVLQWLAVSGVAELSFIVTPNGRIGGAMGNAAFLAAYLGLTFFATLAAAPQYGKRLKSILYMGAGLQLFATILTGTRGTLLALLVTGSIILLYQALWGERLRTYARVGIAVALLILGTFFIYREPLSHSSFTPIRRIASISLSDPTVASRLFIWNAVSREALSRPILGYGAEHVDIPFDRVYDPSVITEEWFDRSHNAYLDYLVQFGIFGVLLYIALVLLLLSIGFRIWRAGDRYGIYILGMGSVYALQNFFVFDTGTTLWFFLVLIAVSYVYHSAPVGGPSSLVERPRYVAGALAGAAILLVVIPVAIQPLRANLLAFESYQYQIADVARSNAAAERALSLGTYVDLELGYNAYFMYTEQQLVRLVGSELELAFENASSLLARSFARYPYDARTALYLAQVLSSAPDDVAADPELFSEALTRSLEESPKRSQPWYILANLSLAEANAYPAGSAERAAGYAAAHDLLARYIALVPKLAKPRFVLAQLEYASGDREAAAISAEEGRKYYKSDLETARRAAGYYSTQSDLPNLEFFLGEILEMSPTDYASAYDLAKVKFLLGNKEGARALFDQVRASDATLIDTDPAFKAAITEYERTF